MMYHRPAFGGMIDMSSREIGVSDSPAAPVTGGALRFRSKSEVVADEIRTLIQRGELVPGESLRQRDLAQRFGVSSTPVREAIRQLASEGYLTSQTHRSAIVVRAPEDRISENFLVRAALEGLAAEIAARKIDQAVLNELARINNELAACADDDPIRFQLNRRLHFTVYEAADSPTLLSLLEFMWKLLPDGPGHGRPLSEAVREHSQLIEALRAHDGKAAARLVRKHIAGGETYETDHAVRRPDPVTTI